MSDTPAGAIRVPEAARASLAAALAAHTAPERRGEYESPDSRPEPLLASGAKQLRNHLPCTVLDALSRWRYAPAPWLTVTGLPATTTGTGTGAGERVPTPRGGFCDEALLAEVNLVHFGMLRLLGLTPVAYPWENGGRLVRNVAPHTEAAGTRTSWGHLHGLGWHTDGSVLDHGTGGEPSASIPGFLTFHGIRNTERVPTRLLPVATVVAALPERVADELRRPAYAVTAPESYATDSGGRRLPARSGVPLLWTLPDGGSALRYGPGRVTGLTPWARAALAWFAECLEELDGTRVVIEAGAFHLFDNRRVLHRRDPFRPAEGDGARWLRRCYANAAGP